MPPLPCANQGAILGRVFVVEPGGDSPPSRKCHRRPPTTKAPPTARMMTPKRGWLIESPACCWRSLKLGEPSLSPGSGEHFLVSLSQPCPTGKSGAVATMTTPPTPAATPRPTTIQGNTECPPAPVGFEDTRPRGGGAGPVRSLKLTVTTRAFTPSFAMIDCVTGVNPLCSNLSVCGPGSIEIALPSIFDATTRSSR